MRTRNPYGRCATLAFAASLWFVPPGFASISPGHAPIVIASDVDFTNCACVVSGTGTAGDPYVIGPWSINSASGDAVFVDGTNVTKSFTLLNLTIAGNSTATSRGIVLQNIKTSKATVSGSGTSVQTTGIGIVVENSSGVTLDGGGANPNGPGIGNKGAGTINKNTNGAIDVEESDHVTVRGWQMSANGADILPDWVSLDPDVAYWGVGGIRFFKVTHSVIDHNAANNDTSVSYSLFNSSYNTVTANTGDYPLTMNFLVTAGSTYNSLIGNVAGTGDFLGYLVADPLPGHGILETYGPTHDNILHGNVSHSDGPTGSERKSNVVPAFLGGIVVLNGTYDNTITNNQVWGTTGPNFGWAQVEPATSRIGVVTYPPSVQCNVTVSSGGGGVVNLNGNVWTGNSAKVIAPCIPAQ